MVMGHANFGEVFENFIASFNMPVFFILSGYLFKDGFSRELFYKKTRSIILPYLKYLSITIVLCAVLTAAQGTLLFPLESFFYGILYGNRGIMPINGALWFLQCLLFIEVLYMSISALDKYIPRAVSFIALLIIAVIVSYTGVKLPFSIDSTLVCFPFFYAGTKLKASRPYIVKHISRSKLTIVFIAMTVLFIPLNLLNWGVNPRTCTCGILPLFYLNGLLGSLIVYIVAVKISLFSKRAAILSSITSIVERIGVDSIVYLGLNQLVIYVLRMIISTMIVTNNRLIEAIRNIVVFILTILVIWYINKTRKMCSPKIYPPNRK
jgi:fucose 4-O-acetylase-like acetyltransferase